MDSNTRARRRPVAHLVAVLAGLSVAFGAAAADHGQPLWLDLVTEDADTAASFYEELLGWEIVPGREAELRVRNDGRDIAAIYQISNEMPNAPESQWLVGIVTDDLERSLTAARAAGAAVLRDVTEVPGSGRYAVLRDPQRAVVMLGTPSRDLGGPRAPGNFVWAELWTDDLDAAADFYAKVLGYERRTVDRPEGSYTVLSAGDAPQAGLVETPNVEVKPAWAPYIAVSDLAATVARVEPLGGAVLIEPTPEFAGGRVALIADPTQAALFIVQLPDDLEASR
jgi:predicted enzyme related to lactoylglutathione lyase